MHNCDPDCNTYIPTYTMAIELNIKEDVLFDELGYKPHPKQQLYHNSTARYRIPCCGRRFGKALDIATPILTADGWKTMGILEIGDRVFDETGKTCTITGVTDFQYGRPCYLVSFSSGADIIADSEHEWLTWDKPARKAINDSRRHTKPQIRTTREIAESLLCGRENNHAVQLCQGIEFDWREYPIDPYTLGVWLGDGTTGSGFTATITCHDDDSEIMRYINEAGYPIKHYNQYLWGVSHLITELKSLNLWGNKHVPEEYLYGSKQQRLRLLHGLMDSDGSVGGQGQCDFTNMNKSLVDTVETLAVSLGAKVTRYTRRAVLNGKDYGQAYRANVTATFPLFRLKRKVIQQFNQSFSPSRNYRFITNTKQVESVPVRCIEVDSPSHLYLAGLSLIPTHNSLMTGHRMTGKMFIPDSHYWIVGPTYSLGEKEFRVVFNDLFRTLKLASLKGVRKSYNVEQGSMRIQMPWNTVLEVKSAEKQDSLVGEGLDGCIMSEAALHKKDTWEMYIEPALLDKHGWCDFPSTPRSHNWYEGFWLMGQDPAFNYIESWRFPTWENRAIFPLGLEDPEIQELKRKLPGFHWLQEYCAEFTAIEGRIYPEFSRDTHVTDIAYNPFWKNYQVFDFGFAAPFVCLDIMVDPSDNVYVWREYQVTRKTNTEHAMALQYRENPQHYHVDGRFGDPRDPDAIRTLNMVLGGAKIIGRPLPVLRGMGEWIQGIDAVKQWMIIQGDGKPKIFFDRSCTETIRQIDHLQSNIEREGRNTKEGQKDYDDHGADALRYFFAEYFVLGYSRDSLSAVYGARPGRTEADDFFTYHSQLRANPKGIPYGLGA